MVQPKNRTSQGDQWETQSVSGFYQWGCGCGCIPGWDMMAGEEGGGVLGIPRGAPPPEPRLPSSTGDSQKMDILTLSLLGLI